ncbi:MAG: radical SAM protein [Desulfobacteraceae bacterium]|nr:radical SAM protein [Desulfobacteraceae bacterium]
MAPAAPTPYVIPLFIPHEGCPHRCLFCNQHSITGRTSRVTAAQARAEIETWLVRPHDRRREVQVAFYGGTFTALSRARQEELLGAVRPYLDDGKVAAVRLSTRPDGIDGEIARFLAGAGVRIAELGVQSMSDEVLARSGRGHTAAQVEEGVRFLRTAGIAVGAQLMLGLPGETTAGQLAGLRRLLTLRPGFLRLYPALVLRGSGLAVLYAAGRYQPLSLAKAVALAGKMKTMCDAAGVPVVRMGLQPSPELEREIAAGPYHPAFGELVASRLLFGKVRRELSRAIARPRVLTVARADESAFRGRDNSGPRRLAALGLLSETRIEYRSDQPRQTIRLIMDNG